MMTKKEIFKLLLTPIIVLCMYTIGSAMSLFGFDWNPHGNLLILLLITFILCMITAPISIWACAKAVLQWIKNANDRTWRNAFFILLSIMCNAFISIVVGIRMLTL